MFVLFMNFLWYYLILKQVVKMSNNLFGSKQEKTPDMSYELQDTVELD